MFVSMGDKRAKAGTGWESDLKGSQTLMIGSIGTFSDGKAKKDNIVRTRGEHGV